MTVIFDGRAVAQEKEKALQSRIVQLKEQHITPKLVSIVVGNESGALMYQNMKKKIGERVGVEVEVREVGEKAKILTLLKLIRKLNNDATVHGVMIQLPLPNNFSREDRETLINSIAKEKDVDGMREDSALVAPVVMAILQAVHQASNSKSEYRSTKQIQNDNDKNPKSLEHLRIKNLDIVSNFGLSTSNLTPTVVVVGAKGFEGGKVVKVLRDMEYEVWEVDKETKELKQKTKDADVIISCTGVPNLITGEMIKKGVVAIDAGAPKGDFDFESVSKKASFITPVPGGVGPVTIINLMENVVKAASI